MEAGWDVAGTATTVDVELSDRRPELGPVNLEVRGGNHEFGMGGGDEPLVLANHVFAELFARLGLADDDRNRVLRVPQLQEPACQLDDADLFAHVKNEDLAAHGQGGGLNSETGHLANREKVAR